MPRACSPSRTRSGDVLLRKSYVIARIGRSDRFKKRTFRARFRAQRQGTAFALSEQSSPVAGAADHSQQQSRPHTTRFLSQDKEVQLCDSLQELSPD
jgi:hypothetical protein